MVSLLYLLYLFHQEFSQEFPSDGNDLEIGPMEVKLDPPNQKRKDNDDLDLALDALRDCDTDFSKFVQVIIWYSVCSLFRNMYNNLT